MLSTKSVGGVRVWWQVLVVRLNPDTHIAKKGEKTEAGVEL
ncbi:hypothetical protein [Candidatus Nitrotoga sp. BS]|nr:hypothetical protein [Candidatus Nitrotoga sp. BS]